MKIALLLMMIAQTACVSAFKMREDRPIPQYAHEYESIRWSQEHAQKNAAQWAEWDKKYVSDDVVVIEIFDENGKKVLHGTGR